MGVPLMGGAPRNGVPTLEDVTLAMALLRDHLRNVERHHGVVPTSTRESVDRMWWSLDRLRGEMTAHRRLIEDGVALTMSVPQPPLVEVANAG
jgi:hypothetical protein